MYRLYNLLYNPRVLAVIALIILLVFLFNVLTLVQFIALIATLLVISVLVAFFYFRKKKKSQQDNLVEAIQDAGDQEELADSAKDELKEIRSQMNDAIKTIRKSRLGDTTGKAALYELPWYMIIGNPAAGKSSAVLNSGLRFPFSEKEGGISVKGVGGTRNCDWFFSSEGILLDTAGRYSVYDEDRKEWLGFLSLLKKNRSRAPINGIIIAVSIAELTSNNPEHTIALAKNLRNRVQDLTEQLEVFAPVYVVFTKADLISGFREFFDDYSQEECEQVWGATLPYIDNNEEVNITELFEEQFDILSNGLKDLSASRLALRHEQTTSPSLMTFPMEFQSIRPVLRTLIYTLFESNPFQFKPIFRGFYFTSSLQEGVLKSKLTEEIVRSFDLSKPQQMDLTESKHNNQSFFLKNLFSKVILKDKQLVKQHTNRKKRQQRHVVFAVSALCFTSVLALWAWSYTNNKELVERVEADFMKVQTLQQSSSGDLKTQFESLGILQARLEQLDKYDENLPFSHSLGLYQGKELRKHLEAEYYYGIKKVMLSPVEAKLKHYLQQVNLSAGELKQKSAAEAADQPKASIKYVEASPTDSEDAYNALKAYLMLADHSRADSGHLNDQITKFWRQWLEANRGQMSRTDMMRSAEQILSYSISNIHSPKFPSITSDLALIDETRHNLSKVVTGMPAQERVYSELKMRASARFPSITVANILGDQFADTVSGSHVVSGTFTKKAWDEYVSKAIDKAATERVAGDDWVLKTSQSNDLTLVGSPEQIRKQLVSQYKKDYIAEWNSFIEGIHYKEASGFQDQVALLNILGDTNHSPISKLFDVINHETSWDKPTTVTDDVTTSNSSHSGFINWFKRAVLRQAPGEIQRAEASLSSSGVSVGGVGANSQTAQNTAQGLISGAFTAINNLVSAREENAGKSLLENYIENLVLVRSRFNRISSLGDFGPESLLFASETLGNQGSEISRTLQVVDEQILSGVKRQMRERLQPLLSTPVKNSFKALLEPTKTEINKTWQDQVYTPFNSSLANKYPFNPKARIEATSEEVSKYIGKDGEIAKFVEDTLSPFIVRRGEQISSKVWNDIGLGVAPIFVADFPRYLSGNTTNSRSGNGSSSVNKTTFQLMPKPVGGLTEYTVVIDGQQLRYRMGVQAWTTFVWPNPSNQPGASIRAKDFDGREITVFEEPGTYGLDKMLAAPTRTKQGEGIYELQWTGGGITIPMHFRVISNASDQNGSGVSKNSLTGLTLPRDVVDKGITLASADKDKSKVVNQTANNQSQNDTNTSSTTNPQERSNDTNISRDAAS